MNKRPNNRVQGTLHRVSGPLNRNVGTENRMNILRPISAGISLAILAALMLSTSCTILPPEEPTTRFDNRNQLHFLSPTIDVDFLQVSGVDLGIMYSPRSYTPKYVGDMGYITYDGIKVGDSVAIVWQYSSNSIGHVMTNTIARPGNIPSELPANTSLILMFDGKDWSMSLEPF